MFCPAKINLFLRVLDQRPDGYHELETVFLPLPGLADDLKVSLNEDSEKPSTITATGKFQVPQNNSNLCLKAVEAFAQETNQKLSVAISLVKNIPVAAGLGGGSSDAATTIRLLNKLCRTRLDDFQLRAIARKIGADVPFFINPQVSLATGIGDILTPIPLMVNLTVLLVTPCFPVPVAWAYQNMTLPEQPQPELKDLQHAMIGKDPRSVAQACRNDLEHAILRKFPILELMTESLRKAGAFCAHVSGSGPSLFALVDPSSANRIKQNFTSEFPGFNPPELFSVTVC